MIAAIEDIRAIRNIASNVNPERIEPYIEEVENTYIIPAIGAELYEGLTGGTKTDATLTNGGYYDNNGKRDICHGLKKAIAYFAYCRVLRNNQINVTAFGVVGKTSSLSSPTPTDNIEAVVTDAAKMAEMYLESCTRYLNRTACPCDGTPKKNISIQILD